MKDQRTFAGVRLWVAAGLSLALLAVATYALAAPPGASHRFTPVVLDGAANATAWRSGWVAIGPGETLVLNHNLGINPDDLAVDIWFNDIDDGWGINRRYYGGVESGGQYFGASWKHLTDTSITIYREADDTAADQVWVTVWPAVRGPDDYVSDWTDIARAVLPADALLFNHNLNLPAAELMVSVMFSGTTEVAGVPNIHHQNYGSKEVVGNWQGAAWLALTNNTVKVRRAADDDFVEQVRVAVTQPPTPVFSQTVVIGQNADVTLNHNLDWEPTMLLVRAECFNPNPIGPFGIFGIHQALAGGNHSGNPPFQGWQGAALQNLTANQVTLHRFADDVLCPVMRVRIWQRSTGSFLPVVVRD